MNLLHAVSFFSNCNLSIMSTIKLPTSQCIMRTVLLSNQINTLVSISVIKLAKYCTLKKKNRLTSHIIFIQRCLRDNIISTWFNTTSIPKTNNNHYYRSMQSSRFQYSRTILREIITYVKLVKKWIVLNLKKVLRCQLWSQTQFIHLFS